MTPAHRRRAGRRAPTPTFYETDASGDVDTASTRHRAGDSDALVGADWTPDPADRRISCVHPGWPVLTGRGEVLRSYALIMANTDYIQFFLTDVKVAVTGDTALVTCTENILSGGPAEDGGASSARSSASSSSPPTCSAAHRTAGSSGPTTAPPCWPKRDDDEDDETALLSG